MTSQERIQMAEVILFITGSKTFRNRLQPWAMFQVNNNHWTVLKASYQLHIKRLLYRIAVI